MSETSGEIVERPCGACMGTGCDVCGQKATGSGEIAPPIDLLAVVRKRIEDRGGLDGRAMDAYWFGFDRTGNEHIDRLLAMVATAGKAYHTTEFWNDDDDHDGWSYIDLIQAAANEAAQHFASDEHPS